MYLRQSTSQAIKIGPFIDATDGKTEETALSIAAADVRLSKDGGNYAASSSGGATHDELGMYDKTLSTTDTNTVGELVVSVHDNANHLPVQHRYWVLEERVYDLLFGASATGDVTVESINSGVITAAVIAADAITSAKIADDAISNEHLADSVAVGALYGGGVWFDDSAGTTGTTVGTHGIPTNPVNDFDDAVTLAGSTGLDKIFVVNSAATPTSAVGSVKVIAVGAGCTYNVNSQVHTDTELEGLSAFGNFGASSDIRVRGGIFSSSNAVGGEIVEAALTGLVQPRGSFWTYLFNCYHLASSTFTLDMTNNSANVAAANFSGAVTLTNMDSTNTVIIDGNCSVTIDGTCTGGTVIVRGQVDVTDNSGAAVTVTAITGVNLTQINGETSPVETWARILNATIDTTITSGGGSTTTFSAAGIPTLADDRLIDKVGVFVDGGAIIRGFVVRDYVESTKTLTVDTLDTAPSNGDRFLIFA